MNVGIELLAASNMYANDINTSNASASGYVISNFRAFARQEYQRWKITETARLNNLFDTYYVGSVIINQASNQYFEPSPGRNWFVGINASYSF
jgi:iron complex outermembrane receptor protein